MNNLVIFEGIYTLVILTWNQGILHHFDGEMGQMISENENTFNFGF